jgi:hypothetical protein
LQQSLSGKRAGISLGCGARVFMGDVRDAARGVRYCIFLYASHGRGGGGHGREDHAHFIERGLTLLLLAWL